MGESAMTPWLRALPLLCLWAYADADAACTCLKDSSPLEQQVRSALWSSDYVAVVEIGPTINTTVTREEPVANWNPKTLQSEESTRVVEDRLLLAKFKALRIYKGDKSAAQLETPAEITACGIRFTPGSRYLLYAYGPEDNGRVSTGSCMRTALADDSTREMEILTAITRRPPVVFQYSGAEKQFRDAIDLIHSDAGDGDASSQAMAIAGELASSDPLSGYSQALQAEMFSTTQLLNDVGPAEVRQDILPLADEALQINPRLAQAHVARARAYASAAKLKEAEDEIQAAFQIEPQLTSAIFAQAQIYRLSGDGAKAQDWARWFIAAEKQPAQKANGHDWLGNMLRDIGYKPEGYNRQMYLLVARSAYQSAIALDPKNPQRLVNFAAFLNEYPADFAAAEDYATRALAVEDTPLARQYLAAARYQALQAKGAAIDAQSLKKSLAEIEASTGVSLDQAVEFGGFREVIRVRLSRLQSRARAASRETP